MTNDWTDDNFLLSALGHALRDMDDPPPDFIAAGQSCHAWFTIDSELAELTYDSARHHDDAATRAEVAAVQALTFTGSHLTIELEIEPHATHGQIVPPQLGEIEFQVPDGEAIRVRTDEFGYFTVAFVPSGRFRLRCSTSKGVVMTTSWVTLDAHD